MLHQEKYTLTWHSSYSDHLKELLKEMMTSSQFADVTLVTDDKQQIRAHRNILSACSPVFKNILQLDPSKANSVIYLRGIQHSEMESIMDFIYLGEARIYEERVSEFIMVSKNLEIKELSTELNDHDLTPTNKKRYEQQTISEKNEDISKPTLTLIEDITIAEPQAEPLTIIPNKSADGEVIKPEVVSSDAKHKCQDCDKMFNSKGYLTEHIKSKHEGRKYACNQCDFQASFGGNLKKHFQSKHEGLRYACNQCDYEAPMRRSLKQHIQSVHEGIKYPCTKCDFQATRQDKLKVHTRRKHL